MSLQSFLSWPSLKTWAPTASERTKISNTTQRSDKRQKALDSSCKVLWKIVRSFFDQVQNEVTRRSRNLKFLAIRPFLRKNAAVTQELEGLGCHEQKTFIALSKVFQQTLNNFDVRSTVWPLAAMEEKNDDFSRNGFSVITFDSN